MKKYLISLLVMFFTFPVMFFAQRKTTGIVKEVVDGDTYKIECSYKKVEATYRIRIVNVDAPEVYFVAKKRPAQEFADSISSVVEHKLLGKEVSLYFYGTDRFNRVLAFISLDGERIDHWLLKEGLAWAYKEYHPQKGYKNSVKIMNQAKDKKIGLWAGKNIVEPSKWRAQ